MKSTKLAKPQPDFSWDQMDRLVTEQFPDGCVHEPMPKGACTVKQFREHRGITNSLAVRQLDELVKRGIFDKGKRLLNRNHTNIYWPIVK